MIGFLFICLAALSSDSTHSAKVAVDKTATHWGAPISMASSTTVKEAIRTYKEPKTVLLSAKVNKVCKKKGCWMIMEDADQKVRVTFEKYAFFVPENIQGKKVDVQGRLFHKEISVAQQKHFLKDGGADEAAIAAVTKPKKEYRFVATGVRLSK